MPGEVDVVIIGGGIIGITTAWYLLKRGLSVVVCEKGRVAGEQSSRNWGWVRVTGRDEAEVPIAIESTHCWETLSEEIGEELGFTRQGVLALAETDEEMAGLEAWMDIARRHQTDSVLLSQAEVAGKIDVSNGAWRGGLITPSDARAEPFTAVPAIARACKANGAAIRENCAVRTLDIQAGRLCGVVTETGTIKTNRAICSAGAWSGMFLKNIGISFPQLSVKGTVARTRKAKSVFNGAAGLKDIFIRRRRDGGYTVASAITEHAIGPDSFRHLTRFLPATKSASEMWLSLAKDKTQSPFPQKKWTGDDQSPFEENRVLNPSPSKRSLKLMRKKLGQTYSATGRCSIC